MSSRFSAATLVVSVISVIGVMIDFINTISLLGDTNDTLSRLVVPVYSIVDVAGLLAASLLVSATRGQDILASAALFLCSGPVIALYVYFISTNPDEAADRVKAAGPVVESVFEGLGVFVTRLFT